MSSDNEFAPPQRREKLLQLLERYMPTNAAELLEEVADGQNHIAVVERGPYDDFISLHAGSWAALTDLASDDSDYVPKLLVDLDSGEEREIEAVVSYRIAGAHERSPELSDIEP